MTETPSSLDPPSRAQQGDRGGPRLLVADDFEPFRRFAIRALELHGWSAIGVPSRAELERAIVEDAWDAVLLDWHLGGGDSAEMVRTLAALGIPVIVLTGDPSAVHSPGLAVLGKPVTIDRLCQEVEAALGRTRTTS